MLVNKDVFGLKVSMHNVLFVNQFNAHNNLSHVKLAQLFRKPALLLY